MPHPRVQRLEHIGIAVEDVEAVRRVYADVLGIGPYKTETVEREGVRTHFLATGTSPGGAKLEWLEATSPDSPVARHLERRGEGLHHLAFEVEDLPAHMDRLRALGYRLLGDAPKPGADGKRIIFLHPKETAGVLVELCETVSTLPEPALVSFGGEHLATYVWGDSGERVPIVLLHGAAGSTRTDTADLAALLAPHAPVVALDFAGHGASGEVAGRAFSIELFAENVLAALDHFGITRGHLLGFSMGGYVALYLARHYAGRVHRLAVHATRTDWDAAQIETMRARLEPSAFAPPLAERLDAEQPSWRARFARMSAHIADYEHGPLRDADLAQITAPVLVTAADRDDLFPLAAALRLHAHLPEARLAILPGTRHSLRAVDLPTYARLTTDFFDGTHPVAP